MAESVRWLLRVAVVALVTLVSSFPTGPPLSACTDMNTGTQVGTIDLEGHTSLPMNYQPGSKTNIGPYYIQIHGYEDHYMPDTDYSVSIVANQSTEPNFYQGLLLQARRVVCAGTTVIRVEDEPLGEFTIPSDSSVTLQTMDCMDLSRSALCHRTRQMKTNETAMWRSPSDLFGPIVLRMTIVKEATEYWTEQNSIIMVDTSGQKPPSCAATDIRFTFALIFLASIINYIAHS